MEHVGQLVKAQREYFQSGAPRSPGFRIRSLKRLYAAIAEHKQEIERALFLDLGKQETESYETESGWYFPISGIPSGICRAGRRREECRLQSIYFPEGAGFGRSRTDWRSSWDLIIIPSSFSWNRSSGR